MSLFKNPDAPVLALHHQGVGGMRICGWGNIDDVSPPTDLAFKGAAQRLDGLPMTQEVLNRRLLGQANAIGGMALAGMDAPE
ncbi:hypothetical protein [Nitrospirillum sp. BR 11163]|uniref:hypothetical protein n=1 Tax=Nitrospirillum sp. BR 11163 TaxID=3104323 RepID=UPI002B001F3F|nr:hypothetical protein [Nitrospirillum sp. BR 11163]MEA1676893.1 hypothetical protein [Nitrospirillum sp. BR 11163]